MCLQAMMAFCSVMLIGAARETPHSAITGIKRTSLGFLPSHQPKCVLCTCMTLPEQG